MGGPSPCSFCFRRHIQAVLESLTLSMADSLSEADLRDRLAALHPDCYGWALACCGRDRSDAEDVLQRAYVKILDGRARFRGSSSLRTFVFGVIRMTAREDQRRVRLFANSTSPGSDRADQRPLPDAAAFEGERREQLLHALTLLSARQREVLELVFYHEMTIAEAAVVMNVRMGSARTHYERGKARLRALLPQEVYGNV